MRRPHHVSSREIERKFLIKGLPVKILRSRHFPIAQGYLANEPRGRRLRKTRHEIPWKNLKIEVDIYHGRNHGLVVAEVEFPNHASCRRFKPPRWFGREITGEKRYSNVRLARE